MKKYIFFFKKIKRYICHTRKFVYNQVPTLSTVVAAITVGDVATPDGNPPPFQPIFNHPLVKLFRSPLPWYSLSSPLSIMIDDSLRRAAVSVFQWRALPPTHPARLLVTAFVFVSTWLSHVHLTSPSPLTRMIMSESTLLVQVSPANPANFLAWVGQPFLFGLI